MAVTSCIPKTVLKEQYTEQSIIQFDSVTVKIRIKLFNEISFNFAIV